MHKKLALALFLAIAPQAACTHPQPPDVVVHMDGGEHSDGLTVTGTATIGVSPDCADLTITITREAKQPGDAITRVQDRQDAVVTALQKLGLANGDITLSHVSVDPVYEYINNRAELRGYESTVTITATTRRFEQVASLMEAAAEAGATSMRSQFRRSDLESMKQEVRAKAIAAAQAKAKETATALGVPLGRVVAVVEANQSYLWSNTYFPPAASSGTALGGDLQPLTIDVTITYAI